MKLMKRTLGMTAAALAGLSFAAQGEESVNPVLTSLSQTTISGYVDTSAIWTLGSDNLVQGRSFDGQGKQDGFNLNVAKLAIARPIDESAFAAGYNVELLFGPDANTLATQSAQSIGAGADFGIKQAYVELRIPAGNGIDVKMGVWDTLIGYEGFDSVANANYSRSFGYFIEPTTHTGVLASYEINEIIGVKAGVANTFGAGINGRSNVPGSTQSESIKTYLGMITITAPDNTGFLAGSTLSFGVVDSGTIGSEDAINYYIGGQMNTPIEKLTLGAAYDYRGIRGTGLAGNARTIGLYASYQATDKLGIHGRLEYAKGDNGVWIGNNTGRRAGEDDELQGVTVTVQYDLWKDLISRAEVRWDHDRNGKSLGSNTKGKDDAVSLALNLIYQF